MDKIFKLDNVITHNVDDPTYANNVRDRNLSTCVNYVLNLREWEITLNDHPDPEFRKYIIDGIKYGVNIGHSGHYIENNITINHNWPSAYKYREAVEASIQKDVSKGRKLGPYESAPCPFISSPLGAFEKRRSHGKYRVIHDLSWPPGQSVNEGIVKDCSVKYVTIDVITDIIKSFGQTGVKMSKLDLEDAYRHIFVRPEDRFLLGSVWDYINPDGSVCRKYLLDATLPFGLKSSAKHFNKYADALQYAMLRQGASTVCHVTTGCIYSMPCYDRVHLQYAMLRQGASTVCHVTTGCIYSRTLPRRLFYLWKTKFDGM